ncbi:uncharacterized protein [Haliotis asinina]|uniref:uncharacterized protein n=1 Tax=Haliotis asinina TaxID=109174 RepID=UPI0035321C67
MLIPAQLARSQGRCCHPYLDDWLLRALRLLLSHDATQQVMDILLKLGWIINLKKSDLTPMQDLVFLGARFNTAQGIVSLAPDRIVKVQRTVFQFLEFPRATARTWLHLLGTMAATVDVVWRARLRMRPIQQALAQLWSHSESYETILETPAWLIPHLQWWTEVGNLSRGIPLETPTPSLSIQTDASLTGWGGVLGELSVSGRWAEDEVTLHINVLELRAVRRVFGSFVESVRGQVVRLEMDNQTAMTYILKQGGTVSPSLLQEAWQFLLWCDQFDIRVLPFFLPGIDNVRADALSRRILAPHKWMLHRGIFGIISQWFGSFQVDLFASGATNQIPVSCSRIPDPRAISQQRLSARLDRQSAVRFPPVPLISRVLLQLTAQLAWLLVLLAPLWSAQSGFPVILRFLAQPPVLLPFRPDLLSQNGAPHPNPRIQWVAWLLSGVASMREEFLHQLQTQFWLRGGIRRTFNMRIDGPVMLTGVSTGGFSIPFLQI